MTSTLLTLRKPLPDTIVRILISVTKVTARLSITSFIVGATARDIIFENIYGIPTGIGTQDIDFGVAVASWDHYDQLKLELIKSERFTHDKKADHRLWIGEAAERMKIDLIPFGGLETSDNKIFLPPNSFRMNIAGFREAHESAHLLQIADGLQIGVVSLAGLAMLKFIAYDDKPQERQSDLRDIWFIASKYLDADNEERLYTDGEILNEPGFDVRTVGARFLGRDMSGIVTSSVREIVLTHLSESADSRGVHEIAEIIFSRFNRGGYEINGILETLRQLRLGILEENKS